MLAKKSEKPQITAIKDEKFNEDYLRVLRKKKGQETFLEKLLETEIIRERYELLQCLHFVVTNGFFKEAKNSSNCEESKSENQL